MQSWTSDHCGYIVRGGIAYRWQLMQVVLLDVLRWPSHLYRFKVDHELAFDEGSQSV